MFSIKRLRHSTLTFSLLVFSSLLTANDMSDQAISDRIAPIGSVRLSTDIVETAAVEVSNEPRTAQTIYNTFCTACHAIGIAGAPALGDKAAWDLRLAKGRETINNNAINGIGAMPARGTCMNCSDEEIISTIDYMLAQ